MTTNGGHGPGISEGVPPPPWFPFFPRDWRNSETVAVLGPSGRGIYICLMAAHWEKGSLPTDERSLATLGMCDRAELREVWPILRRFFPQIETPDGPRLQNPKLAALWGKATAKSQAARANARSRWGSEDAGADAAAVPTQCEAETETTTLAGSGGRKTPPPPVLEVDQALAQHLAELVRARVNPKAASKGSRSSALGFGRLRRRLRRESGDDDASTCERIRGVMASVFDQAALDGPGFTWGRQLLSGASWSAKTRDGTAYRFDLAEADVGRPQAPAPPQGGRLGRRSHQQPGEHGADAWMAAVLQALRQGQFPRDVNPRRWDAYVADRLAEDRSWTLATDNRMGPVVAEPGWPGTWDPSQPLERAGVRV